METHTLRLLVFQRLERDFPYSLGKPIDWKPEWLGRNVIGDSGFPTR